MNNIFSDLSYPFKCICFIKYIYIYNQLYFSAPALKGFHPARITGLVLLSRHYFPPITHLAASWHLQHCNRGTLKYQQIRLRGMGRRNHIKAYKVKYGQRNHSKEQLFSCNPSQNTLQQGKYMLRVDQDRGSLFYLFSSLLFTVTKECSK